MFHSMLERTIQSLAPTGQPIYVGPYLYTGKEWWQMLWQGAWYWVAPEDAGYGYKVLAGNTILRHQALLPGVVLDVREMEELEREEEVCPHCGSLLSSGLTGNDWFCTICDTMEPAPWQPPAPVVDHAVLSIRERFQQVLEGFKARPVAEQQLVMF